MKKLLVALISLSFVASGCTLSLPWAAQNPSIQPPVIKTTSTQPVACTQEAKICPDGSSVGRTGANCEFAPCTTSTDQTAGWKTLTDSKTGFEFKYPANFFDANQQPKILIGDCNYSVFPARCPDINNIVINDQVAAGGDINAIKSNLNSPNYWLKPAGEKLAANNVAYCLYQTADAATGHVFNSYYYVTVANNECLVVNLNTSTTNCDFYLPLEPGNTEQQKNYNDCLTKNQAQPKILDQIVGSFKFPDQNQSGCNSDSDCQNGASCLVVGPLIANQPVHKVCVPKGSAVPL